MQSQIARRTAGRNRRINQNQRFGDDEQQRHSADEHLALEGARHVRAQQRAKLLHVPVGAKHHHQIEQEGRRDQTDGLDRPQAAIAAEQCCERPADIDGISDGGAGDIEMRHVAPRPRQLPEADRIIAHEGEDRECGGVENDLRGREWPVGHRPTPQRQTGRAGWRGEEPGLQAQGSPDGQADQKRAGDDCRKRCPRPFRCG
jgi:hypothetical protein